MMKLAKLSIKGTVQLEARQVENGLKRCILTKYITALLLLLILKRHHHQKGIKQVLAP
jgi:hypothetical protein